MGAMFEFSGQLSVVENNGSWWASFELFNVGDESGQGDVGVEVDGSYITTHSETLSPSTGATPWVDLGQQMAGVHTALLYVNPGSGQNDHLQESFNA